MTCIFDNDQLNNTYTYKHDFPEFTDLEESQKLFDDYNFILPILESPPVKKVLEGLALYAKTKIDETVERNQ